MKYVSPLKKLDATRTQSSSLRIILFLTVVLGLGTWSVAWAQSGGSGTSGSGSSGTSGSGSSSGTSGAGSSSTGSSGSSSSSGASGFSQVQNLLSVRGQVQNGALIVEFGRKDVGNPSLMGSIVSPELVADGSVAFYPLPNFALTPTSSTGGTGSTGSTGTASGGASGTSGTAGSSSSAPGATTSGSTGASLYDPYNLIYSGAQLNTAGGPWYLMTAEIPLQETEVNTFVKALNGSDITVGAIHNHYIMDNPRWVFVHLEGVVNQPRILQFKAAIAQTGIGQITDETENNVARLNQNQIGSILGGMAVGTADVVDVTIPRDEQFSSCAPAVAQVLYNRESQGTASSQGSTGQYGASGTAGASGTTSTSGSTGASGSASTGSVSGSAGTDFTAGTGIGTSADWQALSTCEAGALGSFAGGTSSSSGSTGTSGSTTGTASTGTSSTMGAVPVPNQMVAFSEIRIQADGNGQGFLVGELALLPTELDLTRRSLVSQGFSISAIHNHTATLFPQLLFLHIAKHGNAMQMAQTIRTVMDQNRIGAGQVPTPGTSGSSTGTSGTGTAGTGTSGTGTTGTGTTGTGTTGTGTSSAGSTGTSSSGSGSSGTGSGSGSGL